MRHSNSKTLHQLSQQDLVRDLPVLHECDYVCGASHTPMQFNNFCEDEGVHHQLTVCYMPQQNGVLERKNRTEIKMAKSMLAEKGIPKFGQKLF